MPSIISTYLKRAKKAIPFANAIRVGVAVLAVMAVVGASRLLTRRAPPAAARTSLRAPAAAPTPTAPSSTIVTITGCLEQRDETFRLKDTDGAYAPKARTWKTAFLKKGRAPIEVVDAAHRLKLEDHVGQRVNVTGTLIEREMQVRSLKRVAPSCKSPSA